MTSSQEVSAQPFPGPIREGSWLVPTERLRRALSEQELEEQLAGGRGIAVAPMIERPPEWARRHWDAISPDVRLLPPDADRLLWFEVVRNLDGEVHPAGLARLAQEAFALEADWQIDERQLWEGGGQENERYRVLREKFLERLCDGRCESQDRLILRVLQALESGRLGEPVESLTFFGFDELTPLESRLVRAAREHGGGCVLRNDEEHRPPARLTLQAFPDRVDELYAVATAAQGILRREPSCRMGIVLLGGERYWAQLRAVLDDVLCPPRLASSDGAIRRPYSLSLGDPLADYPVVEAALDVLDWADRNRSVEGLSRLLRSPYWGEIGRNGAERFAADRTWRTLGRSTGNDWETLAGLRECPRDFRDRGRAMGRRLEAFGVGRKCSFADWTGLWMGLLADIGWPGSATLDSTEYQAYAAWFEAVQSFSTLDVIDRTWSFDEFRSWVSGSLRERIFQPESPAVPISVMGPLETAGLTFDRLWVLGAEAQVWPPPAHPHPFLPFALQRRLGLPHADSLREFRFGERLVERWKRSASELHVSWTMREGDTEHDLSPYFGRDANSVPVPFRGRGFRAQWRGRARPLEAVPLTDPVPWTGAETRGGTRLLEDQAACPFLAFASHRLEAAVLPSWRLPLDRRERGRLLHAMLEHIGSLGLGPEGPAGPTAWRELVGQAVDLVLETETKRGRLVQALCEALREDFKSRLLFWFETVEGRRKTPFHSEPEREATLVLAGISFRIRADRIDRFPDGAVAIVDYKTGAPPAPRAWLDPERLFSPQLPAYALAWPEARALLVACLNDTPGYRGLRDGSWNDLTELGLATVTDWEGQRQGWAAGLETLAREIRTGRNDLDPRGVRGLPCRRCDFPALCRLHERPDIGHDDREREREDQPAPGGANAPATD
jgi:probable DNA repair protein